MQFIISSETFSRIAKAAAGPDDIRPHLACVRLEYRNGQYYAVASTSWIIAVEYLGETDQSDGFVNVSTAPDHLEWYRQRENLTFDWFPEVGVLMIEGNVIPNVPDTEPMFTRWFDLFPQHGAKVDKGFLYIQAEYFQKLADSSPSGQLAFPEVIDNTRVVIIRDCIDKNWCGAFLANDKTKSARPAVRPKWLP